MGARTIRKIECGRFSPLGAGGLVLRNPERANHRVLGSETSLPLHHGSRILRLDPLLGRVARRACKLPSPAHPAAISRPTDALATWDVGIDARLRASLRRHSPDTTAVARQSGKWIDFSPGVDRGLLFTEATSAIFFLGIFKDY